MRSKIYYDINLDSAYIRVESMYVTRFGNLKQATLDCVWVPVSKTLSQCETEYAKIVKDMRKRLREYVRKRGYLITFKKWKMILAADLSKRGIRIIE